MEKSMENQMETGMTEWFLGFRVSKNRGTWSLEQASWYIGGTGVPLIKDAAV